MRYLFVLLCLIVFSSQSLASEEKVVEKTLAARSLATSGDFDNAYQQASVALILSLEKLPQPHLYTAFINDDLARYSLALRKLDEALIYSEQSVKLIESIGETAVQFEGDILFNRAAALVEVGRIADAITVYENVYDIRNSGSDFEKRASISQALGFAYLEFDRYQLAKDRLRESVSLWERLGDTTTQRRIDSLIALAKIGLFSDDATRSLGDVEKINQRFGQTLSIQNRYQLLLIEANAYVQLSQLANAEREIERAIEISDVGNLIPTHEMARPHYIRGGISILRGDPISAEANFRKNLTLLLKTESEEHPVVLRALHGLAIAKKNIGALEDSDALMQRVIDVAARNFGEEHLAVSASLAEWARILADAGKLEEAIQAARRSYDIVQASADASGFDRGITNNVMGFALLANGQLQKAEPYLLEGTRLIADARGKNSSDLPPGQIALAEIASSFGRLDRARELINQALNIIDTDASATPDRAIHAISVLADLEAKSGNCDVSDSLVRRALSLSESYSANVFKINGAVDDAKLEHDRKYVKTLIDVLNRCESDPTAVDHNSELLFKALQIPQLKSTSVAVSLSGLSGSPQDIELRNLVEQRDQLKIRWRSLDTRLSEIVANEDGTSIVRMLAARLGELEQSIHNLNREILKKFPNFAELFNPSVLSIKDVQRVVEPGTALFLQFSSDDYTQVALVTRDDIAFATTTLSTDALTNAVEGIRRSMLNDSLAEFGTAPTFDYNSAHELYRQLLLPFESTLAENAIEHLLLIPDGAAQRLPFALLLENAPDEQIKSSRGFRNLDFLVKKYSMSVLPSVSSLSLLSRLDTKSGEQLLKSFIGFGDPLFEDLMRQDTRSQSAFIEYAESRVDIEVLAKSFDRIAETAVELEQISGIFPNGKSDIFLREAATERKIKSTDLRGYDVVAFATHGVMADEFANLREPALVFTPPVTVTDTDDGLLTASEIAQLRLDAEWVILSACNTASPVPELGADGLSGLARAFFYAGARSILVTHWEVESRSAQLLSTNAISAWQDGDRGLAKSDALQDSMLSLLEGEEGSRYSHPYYWAPFINVGVR